jgi:hypothetical protein
VVSETYPTAVNLSFLDPEPLLLHSSSSSVILTRLSGPRSRPTTSGIAHGGFYINILEPPDYTTITRYNGTSFVWSSIYIGNIL